MLDGITDVRNFGAIARTCECAGDRCHYLFPPKNKCRVNADAMKTSAGASAHSSRMPRTKSD